MLKHRPSTLRPESLRKNKPGFSCAGQCSVGFHEDWDGARNAAKGHVKHSSSTLRPESLRKTNRAFHAPVNVRWGACPEPAEGLREDSGRSEEYRRRGMLKHRPSTLR